MVQNAHLHLDRRPLAVGGGHHLANLAAERGIGIRVERDPGRLAVMHAGNVRLVHVHFDFERAQVRHRHHRAARQPAAHRGCHDLAHLGLLAQHRAAERRADQRVLEARLREAQGGLGGLDAGRRRAGARIGLGGAALGRIHILLRHQLSVLRADVLDPTCLALHLVAVRLRLDQLGPGIRHARLGLRDLRPVVRVVEARDHVTALHLRPFAYGQIRKPARDLGGYRRPGARDHVAVRRDRRGSSPGGPAGGVERGDDDGLDRHGRAAPHHQHDRGDQPGGHGGEDEAAAERAPHPRRGVTVEAELAEVVHGCGHRARRM